MALKPSNDQYSDEEAQRRFEAALRGAREVGHESMKDISTKAAKAPCGVTPRGRGASKGQSSCSSRCAY
jgi:hypothetical protein